MRNKLAIDIGTAYTKIYKSKVGVVLCEPTVIALKRRNYKKPYAVGRDAEKLIGKTVEDVEIIYPISSGAEIVDTKALIEILRCFVKKVMLPGELPPSVVLSVGCGFNASIIGKFETCLNHLGIYNVSSAEAPILALLGAETDVSEDSCQAIIDLGAGQTTVCVLNATGVISGVSCEIGGNNLNKLIASYLENNLNLSISEYQANSVKQTLASLIDDDDTKTVVQGRETSSGKPKSMTLTASQIAKPVKEFIMKIVEVANMVFSKLPNECIVELERSGVYLTGGGAKLFGLSDFLTERLNLHVHTVLDPELSTVIGAGKLTENKELNQKLKINS